jgi:hypothetical protein
VVGKTENHGLALARPFSIIIKRGNLPMAKRVNKFSVKGELSMAEGIVYEVKKENKEEIIVEIPFFDILREFDGKTVSISISEEREVDRAEEEEETEEYED